MTETLKISSRLKYLVKKLVVDIDDEPAVITISDRDVARRLRDNHYSEAELTEARTLLRNEAGIELQITKTNLPDRIWELMGRVGIRLDHLPISENELARQLANHYLGADKISELKSGLSNAGMLEPATGY